MFGKTVYYLFPFRKSLRSPFMKRKKHINPYHQGIDPGACSH